MGISGSDTHEARNVASDRRALPSVSSSTPLNKSSAVAETGDRLATIDVGQKVGATMPLSVGGAGFPSNTMSPGPRPIPPYQVVSWSIQPFGHNTPTSQTDRQDRQLDNGPIAYGEPFYKRSPKTVYGGAPSYLGPVVCGDDISSRRVLRPVNISRLLQPLVYRFIVGGRALPAATTPCPEKRCYYISAFNFVKRWPIFKILPQPDLAVNLYSKSIINNPSTPQTCRYNVWWNINVRKVATTWNLI